MNVGWPRIIFMSLVCFIGALYRPVKEYFEVGSVAPSHIAISIATFFVGLVIIFFIVRRANKPED